MTSMENHQSIFTLLELAHLVECVRLLLIRKYIVSSSLGSASDLPLVASSPAVNAFLLAFEARSP